MKEDERELFAVFAEAEGYNRPLILVNLTFGRLIDEVIVHYEQNEPFFVDGVPLVKKGIRKLKILRQGERFAFLFFHLHWQMRLSQKDIQKLYGEQYYVRLEALFREACQDVTSQVIKAFSTEIKPRLKDYLPNRKELIQGAFKVFIESIRLLGGSL